MLLNRYFIYNFVYNVKFVKLLLGVNVVLSKELFGVFKRKLVKLLSRLNFGLILFIIFKVK